MYRYKQILKFKKNNLEQKNLNLINNLENVGMLDLMIHQKERWYNRNSMLVAYYSAKYAYDRWVRI